MSVEPNDDFRTRGQRSWREECGAIILLFAVVCFTPAIVGIADAYAWFWRGSTMSGLDWALDGCLRVKLAFGSTVPGAVIGYIGLMIGVGGLRDRKDAANVGK